MKAIIFDLDNTLIDFMKMKQLACGSAVDAMIKAGLKADRKNTLKLLFRLYDKHGYEYKEIFQALLKEMTGKVDYGIVAAGIVAYRKTRESGLLVSYPDVRPTLDKLRRKGIKLAIVTDAPRIEAWIRLAAMKISDMFDVVITFDESKAKKPSTKPFLMALRKLKASPKDTIVLGDSIARDIVPAKKIGIKTILAEYGVSQKEKEIVKPDAKIRRFKDISQTR